MELEEGTGPIGVSSLAAGSARASRTARGGAASSHRRSALTGDQVFAAALRIVDREGVSALSMRRLAQALERDAMLIYRHAANKAALLDGLADIVLGQLVIEPSDQPWPTQLRSVARRFRELALAHPNVVPLLVIRPLATPLGLRPLSTLRPLEAILELLIRAGFAPADALSTYRALFGFLSGHLLNELQEIIYNPEETDDLLRLGLYRLPIGEFPRLRGLASALASYDGAAELEHGLDILIDGISARYAPQPHVRAAPMPAEPLAPGITHRG
ncbi:MAG TPA: TetR/AcrR family transcriptional regulator C-terminal domain-containing protein [Streptosporangiaceae bacterium]|nr:TetR/AcrR family transcriptional regulator C-terminal domain-containing protein [Streptosporangiaceae bacterium]